jgi:hypothetical protein
MMSMFAGLLPVLRQIGDFVRRSLAALAVGAGVLAPLIISSAAWSGGTPDASPSAAAVALADVVRYNEVARALDDAGAKDPAFATVRPGATAGEFVVHRKGGAPDARYAAAGRAALGAVDGLAVRFADAPLTRRESDADVDTLWRLRERFTARGIVVTGVATEWTGPVIVYVADAADVPAARALAGELAPHGAATVTVQQQAPAQPVHRFDDLKPLTGGNRIFSATGVLANGVSDFMRCTSGFGGRSADNRRWMITAFHCVRPGDPRFWAAGSGATYNGAAVLDRSHDIAYIETFGSGGPGTNNRVWDGPRFPETAAFRKTVTSVAGPASTSRLCISGSFSGIRCYGTLGGGGHFLLTNPWRDGDDTYDAYLHWMNSDDGTAQMGQGDSGAPVFEPLGGSDVRAIGMLSAGVPGYTAACVGEGGRTCYKRSLFVNIHVEAVANHGLSLTTP